ncbi:MAG TPA: type II toxin-antitoxin system Phd/YefM family antitoxin [Candidatus Micrarchaeaceae archaeon]|nr:type II toxin-antitoxin system Phd/YefM family antitoxin [Candidatus Micrarchaeaceae archaeon]
MAKVVPFTEARTHLTELLDNVESVHEHVVITRNGRPAAIVMSQAEYDSLIETLEILGDQKLMADLAASDEDVVAGRVVPWEQVKRELGLA